jgi:hypothetical protein
MAQRFKYVLSRKIQNDLISKHNGYKGGDLDVPIIPNTITQQATEQPTPPASTPVTPIVQSSTLPETAQDWKNMSTADLQKLTVDDINNLSEASFNIFYKYNDPLSMSLWNKLTDGNPNKDLLSKASKQRYELDQWWIPETDPLWKTDLIGVPKFWFKHYNQYSWVKSQVIMYGTYEDFQDTTFYKKYSSRIISIKPPKKFGRYMNSEIPGQERNSMGGASSQEYLNNIFEKYGQKWRIMFIQGDMTGRLSGGNDYYVYYIDCTGLPEYIDMLQDFYDDRDTLQPDEIIIMLRLQYLAAVRKHEADLISQGFAQGVASEKAAEEAAQEASEDNSSSIWGTIGSIALDVLPMLL